MTETTWQPGRYLLAGRVSTMPSPVGPIVQPPGRIGTAILYLSGAAGEPGQPALELAAQLALRTGAVVVCCRSAILFPPLSMTLPPRTGTARRQAGSRSPANVLAAHWPPRSSS